MTPKEKAKELVEKFKDAAQNEIFKDWFYYHKRCALIAVDEILLDKMILGGDYKFEEVESAKFWEQVKAEIRNNILYNK